MNLSCRKWIRCIGVQLIIALVAGVSISTRSMAQDCPRLLMFDGVDIRTQTNPEQASYWGRTVGVQGFFVNHLMGQWQNDVGADKSGSLWRLAWRFQKLYSREGVTDNFIKVAIWKRHNWRDAKDDKALAIRFGHAAALAKYAGFKGVAMDLEAYVPIWGGEAGGPGQERAVFSTGRSVGIAMHAAYPGMTLVMLQDALYWNARHDQYHGGYGLALPFLRGLLSAGFKHVVVAVEGPSYAVDGDYANIEANTRSEWLTFIAKNKLRIEDLSVAVSIWPLGKSYINKSARMTIKQYAKALRRADLASPEYIWIYGNGSAWQTGGPYGRGAVAKNFSEYTKINRNRDKACK